MPEPLVSVLLPCRNATSTLHEAMASLTAQTLSDFEIVAVDDGSTDHTAGELERWAGRDGRIRIVRTPPRGIVAALNAASSHARGRFLARMDADDVAAPERLERQLELLESRPDISACSTGVRYFPRSLVRNGARRYERWINNVTTPDEIERDLFVECPIAHPTLLVRRHAFERAGQYRENGWPEDYDLIFRLWGAGQRFSKVPEVLLQWREGPHRVSRTDERYADDAFRRCKIHYLPRRTAGRSLVVWGSGPVGKAFARALQEKGNVIAAFVDLDPRKIGQTIHGAEVIPPAAISEYTEAYHLAAVGAVAARNDIRRTWRASYIREPEDACAVA